MGTAKKENISLKLKGINKRVASNWLFGEQLTIYDFFFAELIELIFDMDKELELNLLEGCDNFKGYLERFTSLPGVKEFRDVVSLSLGLTIIVWLFGNKKLGLENNIRKFEFLILVILFINLF